MFEALTAPQNREEVEVEEEFDITKMADALPKASGKE
jgi:hypothetical protein